jgi:DNA-binding protein YbaB
VEALVIDIRAEMEALARARRERVALTASASREGGRVAVTVNARGVLVDVRFAADATELSLDELAGVLVGAAQDAADDVVRRGSELMIAAMPDADVSLPDVHELAAHAGVPSRTLGAAAGEDGCASEWDYGSGEDSPNIWAQGQRPGGRV